MIITEEERIKAKAVFWTQMHLSDALFVEGTVVDCHREDVEAALDTLFNTLQGIK